MRREFEIAARWVVAGEIGEDGLWPGERPLGVDDPCDRKSSGEEDEHEVLKPFGAIQRVQLPPGKGYGIHTSESFSLAHGRGF